jgi:hypothetical protein
MSVEKFTGRLFTVLLKEVNDNNENDEEKECAEDRKRSGREIKIK